MTTNKTINYRDGITPLKLWPPAAILMLRSGISWLGMIGVPRYIDTSLDAENVHGGGYGAVYLTCLDIRLVIVILITMRRNRLAPLNIYPAILYT